MYLKYNNMEWNDVQVPQNCMCIPLALDNASFFLAEKTCQAGAACTTWQTAISDEGSSHSDTHTLPRGDTKSLGHKSNPQEPEKIGASLSGAVVFGENTGYEKEEDEVELDVLDYSPVLQSRVAENKLDNMGRSLEEEEEEEEGEDDVNVIDVTGDEAE